MRTRVQFPPAPPIPKGQQFAVGLFSGLIAPVSAYGRDFLRTPADCGVSPVAPSGAAFHSLPAVFLSGLALCEAPEVRKGRNACQYKSMTYERTNQAVGSKHRPSGSNHFAGRSHHPSSPAGARRRARQRLCQPVLFGRQGWLTTGVGSYGVRQGECFHRSSDQRRLTSQMPAATPARAASKWPLIGSSSNAPPSSKPNSGVRKVKEDSCVVG